MLNKSLFTSDKQDWGTPQKLFDELNKEFNFDIDVCAVLENAKCKRFYSPEIDGLSQIWSGMCFMNPPYNESKEWIKKAYKEAQKVNCIVVALLPARTDTIAFHTYIYGKAEIRFIKGRLIFGSDKYWEWVWEQKDINGKENKLYKKYGKKNSAPFPSMIIIWR